MELLTPEEIVRLSPPERLALIAQLWDSLEHEQLPLTVASGKNLSAASRHSIKSAARIRKELLGLLRTPEDGPKNKFDVQTITAAAAQIVACAFLADVSEGSLSSTIYVGFFLAASLMDWPMTQPRRSRKTTRS